MTQEELAPKRSWEEIARKKRAAIAASLPSQWQVQSVPSADSVPSAFGLVREGLSPKEIEITEIESASKLLSRIASGDLSAVEVTEAFSHRATIAHQLTNCLSEVLFADAKQRALELDEHYAKTGKTVGPLHGLPISLKDQFRIEGVDTSLGYVSWLGKPETQETESQLVSDLRKLGAVFYCKTNVPTSLMAIETNNNIVGYTKNAHNRLLSSGGSSGGEAALLALRGSILGIGSDVGASIRLPCAFNGIVGLKPSHNRTSCLRVANSMEGQSVVRSAIGGMGHSIQDLRLLTRTMLDVQPWILDPNVVPLPWRQGLEDETRKKIASKKLRFGVIRSDGMVRPHPPVARAVDEAVKALVAKGHEVIEWEPPAHAEAFVSLWDTFAADGGKDIHSQLEVSGEPPVPELAISYGEKVGHLPVSSLNDAWTIETRKYDYGVRYASYWQSTGVDAVIAPAAPTTSHKPTKGRYFGYTGVWNVLDYSAVAVRSGTTVDKAVDVAVASATPLNPLDEEVAKQYDPELFHGMPIGLQVVGQRLEEEQVLAIAEEVDLILGHGSTGLDTNAI
ncbi:Acetamidase [Cercospora beticola]|uniref:amidase n=1 Tax=Cercospora beticola TaxID=122368 RepID=A0A2G5H9S2_CERBT|nr:Acetamidase [Cercospora beticola]PIA89267.1 Acetamidase [Cercospora beticola]WPB03830.1 hypothetical protein RHO25_008474 [Cercospora beticola]CAK1357398.1 unnamed protein product [Cercospora beticola]